MDAESLTSFMAITGADGATAQQYLDLTNWNMEEAVNLFMESGGSGTSGGNGAASSGNHDPFDPYGQQDVRAPDPSKRQRLVGGPDLSSHSGYPLPSHGYGRQDFFQSHLASAASAASRPDALFQRDFAAEAVASLGFPRRTSSNADADGASSRPPEAAQSLSQLFQPPVAIMFYGSLSEARQLAKQERKWLLVNVQDDTVFASLRLNRDTWNDDFVQNLITSGFVFWQIYISSDHCKKFCSLYQLDQSTLPITCILDPVTGQKVVEWHDYIEPQTMAEKLSDFACLNSPGAPVARPAEPSPPRSREWTEDDELAAAIAASLEQPSDDGMKSEAAQAAPPPPPAFVPLPDEPVDGPTVTRVQIRTTAGSRLMRRFEKTAPVSDLWRFVQQELPEARTRRFELRTTYPPATLTSSDTTLAEANLVNASLMMQWTTLE
ncbi:hypothetical protein H310_02617 [Aphanomyces invadans]|uniref:UBX domain-containing protein n=1 Tax=Aphanomyces invadans TaxID=157072 RepID=A0A024UL44_9STRA|nr:hypothetical protein H310_02617 [Aphanomyces invadans]ETW06333.1 hypothetical protein H310_02617 [Aphanomyces invadans]|eukprot:XP_008864408.1 hypothetical protein H310_02617 [Aphanomyces invadans]